MAAIPQKNKHLFAVAKVRGVYVRVGNIHKFEF